MVSLRQKSVVTVLVILAVGQVCVAEQVAPGVEFTVYNLSGPRVLHVVAVDRSYPEYGFAVGWPQGKRNFTSRRGTSNIAAEYDSDHPGADVLAAVNGSFYGTIPTVIGTTASDGEMFDMPASMADTFLFGPSRAPEIVTDIVHRNGTLTLGDGSTMVLARYNAVTANNHITAYTPGWGPSTGTTEVGVEVIIENVSYPMRGDKEISGVVSAVRTGTASTDNGIPSGGMVLSALGTAATSLQSSVSVGDRLRMKFETDTQAYNNADMSITGLGWLVHNGVAYTSNWSRYGSSLVDSRHPRTALAWSDTHYFMVVVDGRSDASIGMSYSQLANFLINTLGAVEAVNLDGGGSSTMVVDGTIRNVPSDGSERSVSNAVLLVERDKSTSFPVEDSFAASGRLFEWQDKFTYNEVVPFSPSSPGGDGYVLSVADPAGGAETVSWGDAADTNYTIEADVYCEYRPDAAGDGSELYGIFARDSGTGAFTLSSYGGGNCYALTYDSSDGRIRACKIVDGVTTDFLAGSPVYMPSTAWRKFAIDCVGTTIRYVVDGATVVSVDDNTHSGGRFGIAYYEQFGNNASIHGTRADNMRAYFFGDFNDDGVVNDSDFKMMLFCLVGPEYEFPAGNFCLDGDIDGDRDVDLVDFGAFQRYFTDAP